jgi:tryptophan 2,3-dioxygenase
MVGWQLGVIAAGSEREQILSKVRGLAVVENSQFDDEAETRQKLNAHGIPDELIARQLATFSANTANNTAVLTSYSLLHSLQHLDIIQKASPRYADATDAVIALYRCAEICLYNIGVLSGKMIDSISAGNVSRAINHARWRAGFHEVLYRLSALVVEAGADGGDGALLDIRYSRIHGEYLEQTRRLQAFLVSDWPEEASAIFGRDLDDPRRSVFFHEFVNSSDERIWWSRLSAVRLPGVTPLPRETPVALYERVINSRQIELMAKALETHADTDLLSFRAVHEIAETIAGYVNLRLCDAIELVATDGNLDAAARKVAIGNRMLTVVDDAMKLLLRALTPNAYKDIRPNLGMVKGTSSVMLRKTLFNTTYPLLARALKLRLADYDSSLADDDGAVLAGARAALTDHNRRAEAELMRQLVVLFQHIRTWRDNHQQFPKTHLGISPMTEKPTVSLSGSAGAVGIAHELRKVHSTDPIAPFYRAVLGTDPPAVHELVTPRAFDEYMSHQTARAVFEVYADVQERFYERMEKKAKPPAHSEYQVADRSTRPRPDETGQRTRWPVPCSVRSSPRSDLATVSIGCSQMVAPLATRTTGREVEISVVKKAPEGNADASHTNSARTLPSA